LKSVDTITLSLEKMFKLFDKVSEKFNWADCRWAYEFASSL